MNTRQALERLQRAEITTSKQMLLRWLRQGKIEAVLRDRRPCAVSTCLQKRVSRWLTSRQQAVGQSSS